LIGGLVGLNKETGQSSSFSTASSLSLFLPFTPFFFLNLKLSHRLTTVYPQTTMTPHRLHDMLCDEQPQPSLQLSPSAAGRTRNNCHAITPATLGAAAFRGGVGQLLCVIHMVPLYVTMTEEMKRHRQRRCRKVRKRRESELRK
jgi:hypothetical protein